MGGRVKHSWTAHELNILVTLRDRQGLDWDEISARIKGTTSKQCRARYHALRYDRQNVRSYRTGADHDKCPDLVLAERERRTAARLARDDEMASRGDCSFMIGDLPPPGRSALDQRRAGV